MPSPSDPLNDPGGDAVLCSSHELESLFMPQTSSIRTLRWSSDDSEAFFSMYPVPELPTSTSTFTSTAITTEPISWQPTHDPFIRSSAKEGEDAKTILILLKTEFPTLQGKVNEEWVRMEVRATKPDPQ